MVHIAAIRTAEGDTPEMQNAGAHIVAVMDNPVPGIADFHILEADTGSVKHNDLVECEKRLAAGREGCRRRALGLTANALRCLPDMVDIGS